jgi:hydrogenase/urease accessory protein HupE
MRLAAGGVPVTLCGNSAMNLFRLLLASFLLFAAATSVARAHQVDSVEFEFTSSAREWKLTGEMDIAFMLPETRGVPGGQPLSRKLTLNEPPAELARMRDETEKTLRKMLRLTFEGQELPLKFAFPDFQNQPFDLPQDARDVALLSVEITTPALPGPGVLRAHWNDSLDSELMAVRDVDGQFQVVTAPSGQATMLLRLDPASTPVVVNTSLGEWIFNGFHHVLPRGLDHLLFILGLFLLLPKWKPLMGQSLLFTVAHSTTLALSVFGLMNFPTRWVEALIAASIAWIGIENLFVKKLGWQRLALVFAFGLIHGLGFASFLTEKLGGVPRAQLVKPLLGFNVGVELAQVTVLVAAFVLTWPLHRWTRQIRIGGSIVIALAGLGWMGQRIFFGA